MCSRVSLEFVGFMLCMFGFAFGLLYLMDYSITEETHCYCTEPKELSFSLFGLIVGRCALSDDGLYLQQTCKRGVCVIDRDAADGKILKKSCLAHANPALGCQNIGGGIRRCFCGRDFCNTDDFGALAIARWRN